MSSVKDLALDCLERLGTPCGTRLEQVEQAPGTRENGWNKRSTLVEHENPQKTAKNGVCSIVPLLGGGTVEQALFDMYGGDPDSPFYVLDDDAGWIGEPPRETARQLRGGISGFQPQTPDGAGEVKFSQNQIKNSEFAIWRHQRGRA